MTLCNRARLRKLAIMFTSAMGLLAWTAAAAAARPFQPASRPDSGEPRDKPAPLDSGTLLLLPNRWDNPDLLAQAAIDLNGRLAQAERSHLVPWDLAEQIRASLAAGRTTADRIAAETRIAYFQSLIMAAMAAGYPDQAMTAARDLLKIDGAQPWNWLAVYRAGMATGDRNACKEAIDHLARAVGPDKLAALEPLKEQSAPVGPLAACSLGLSDGSTWTSAGCKDKVVVIDFWAASIQTSTEAAPFVRHAWETFRDYPDFQMLGVNLDPHDRKPTVYMKNRGIVWPCFFEGQGDRAISLKVFGVRRIPSEAVLSDGKVIYTGLPNDPMFFYAVRAGLVKANNGKVPASQPGSSKVVDPGAKPSPTPGPKTSPSPRPSGSPSPVSNDEKAAADRLKIAEAAEAAGSSALALATYKEILRRWPNSNAAVKAQIRIWKIEKSYPDM